MDKVGVRGSIPVALRTQYFASISINFDLTNVGDVKPAVPPTPSPCLSERAWRGVPLLSDFSARDFTSISGLSRIGHIWLIDTYIRVPPG
jgi:hypothetical protein